MISLSFPQRIACAAAILFGRYGVVTRLAREYGMCRQSVYRQSRAVHDELEEAKQGSEVLVRQQLQQAEHRCDDLQRRLDTAVVVDEDRQAEFAATAQAIGISLPAAHRLLGVVVRKCTPSVATLGRRAKAAAERAAALLPVLDAVSQPRVRQAVADEIFVRRQPILMMVEPASLCWLSGRRVAQRDGATWAEEFGRLPALEQVTKDGGSGLANGLRQANARRRQEGRLAVVAQDDHFHVLREGQRGLRVSAAQANQAVDRAWKAERKERRRSRGRGAGKRNGYASGVALRWRQAEAAYQRWCCQEQAWRQVMSAFTLFDASGQLQTRRQAEATVAAALPVLTGKHWNKTRAALLRPGLWTYLDQAHTQVAALPVPAELCQAALRVEGTQQRLQRTGTEQADAARLYGRLLVATVVLTLAGAEGAATLTALRAVLAGVWRASSAVEGINSVLRMQQSRHRRLTQGLLDLKRFYWNCHPFRTGKRKGHSPYNLLGITLPLMSWWDILKLSPEQLRTLLCPSPSPDPQPQKELSQQYVAA